MSFTEIKREQIKRYILEKISENEKNVVKKTANAFNISLNTVYRYIKELKSDEIIEKKEKTITLKEDIHRFHLYRSKNELLGEDIIYNRYIDEYTKKLPKNVKKIWEYSFMEMMNNAIDHSAAEYVQLLIIQDYLSTSIIISDNGIGIFKKIKEYYHYKSLDDAVNELFKGKLTTDSDHHSGEGIFFTSRVLDSFAVISDGKIFSHDKYYENLKNITELKTSNNWENLKGTIVYMKISNFSNKELKEVFDMFADTDGGFTKTRIPVKNIFETYPVSRSQAKRLCHRFECFQEVQLDFTGIDEIGQGFAHEIFVVFQKSHPDVKIIPQNMTKDVQRMIYHVTT